MNDNNDSSPRLTPSEPDDIPLDDNDPSPPVSAGKRRLKKKKNVIAPWGEIKALYCNGYTSESIADQYSEYGVNALLIRKRSELEQWPTPANLRKRAQELEKRAMEIEGGDMKDDPLAALATRIAEKKLKHQNDVIDIVDKSMDNLKEELSQGKKGFKIKGPHDLERVDAVMRRTLGMDEDDQTSKLAINITAFQTPPTPIKQANATEV